MDWNLQKPNPSVQMMGNAYNHFTTRTYPLILMTKASLGSAGT